MIKKIIRYALAILAVLGINPASAVVSFTLHDEFSGGAQPAGSVQVDVTNSGLDAVQLTITSFLVGTEFMSDLYLNLDPALSPVLLSFGAPVKFGSFANPGISKSADAFFADGGGAYDIKLAFSTSNAGGGVQRFNNTDTLTYLIGGIAGLDENDFKFPAAPHGGNGVYQAAAHIQAIIRDADGNTSGFIGTNGGGNNVPDGGTTVMLLGSALGCLGALRRRFA